MKNRDHTIQLLTVATTSRSYMRTHKQSINAHINIQKKNIHNQHTKTYPCNAIKIARMELHRNDLTYISHEPVCMYVCIYVCEYICIFVGETTWAVPHEVVIHGHMLHTYIQGYADMGAHISNLYRRCMYINVLQTMHGKQLVKKKSAGIQKKLF